MPRSCFPLIFLFLLVSPLCAQLSNAELLDLYSETLSPEKVYIHTDKNLYAGGETIHAAVYLMNGLTNQPASLSKTIYLELLTGDGDLIRRMHLFAAGGHTAATLELPADIIPGDYFLAAYTNFQRNGPASALFRKPLRIFGGLKESGGISNDSLLASDLQAVPAAPSSGVELKFFPESGDCATGIPCRVAVTAALSDGTPVAFTGKLSGVSATGTIPVITNNRGVGSFTYSPTGKSAEVVADGSGERFPLPADQVNGGHIRVDVSPDTIDITVTRADEVNGLRGHSFVLHLRGVGLLEQPFADARKRFKLRLPVSIIPPGVVVGTLLDPQGNAVAERLFFIAPGGTDIDIRTDRSAYGLRAPVQLLMSAPRGELPDSLNAARLSVSVLPMASGGGPTSDDIRTWSMLNSDIDHPIQQAPELIYGEGTPAEKARRIDDFLLTRAWRRFRWEKLPELADYQPGHALEEGLFVRGRMTRAENDKAGRPGKIFLTRMSNAFNDATLTDEEGYFNLGPYIAMDTFPVTLQGRFKRGKKNKLSEDISLEDNRTANLKTIPYDGIDWTAVLSPTQQKPVPEQPDDTTTTKPDEYAEISRKTLTVARNFDSLIIDLQTIDVAANRIDQEEEARDDRTRQFYSTPTRRTVIADNAYAQTTPFLLDVIPKLNGVRQFTDSENQIFFNIRGAESISSGPVPAGIYLDGVLTRTGRLASVQMSQVEFIDVLTPQRAVSLGPDAEGGAIMIYRYTDARGRGNEPGVLETTFEGYHTVREFAVFDPTLPDNRNRPDLRTTLHWAPLLGTDPTGKAQTDFTTSDQTGRFLIFVQGLRNDGTPLYGEGSFEVR